MARRNPGVKGGVGRGSYIGSSRRTSVTRGSGGSGWSTQSRNSDATVRTAGGYVRDNRDNPDPDVQRTDVEIFDKTGPDGVEKTHLSIDTEGNRTVWHGNESFDS